MSSHHIVRDNQEPAVILYDMQACHLGVLQDVLAWSPFIMASPEVYNFVAASRIKIDVLFGNEQYHKLEQSHVEYINEQSEHLLDQMLNELSKRGHRAVYIFAPFAKVDLSQLGHSFLTISIFDATKKWSLIKKKTLKKWFPKGASVQIYGNPKVEVLNAKGYILNTKDMQSMPDSQLITMKAEVPYWLGERLF